MKIKFLKLILTLGLGVSLFSCFLGCGERTHTIPVEEPPAEVGPENYNAFFLFRLENKIDSQSRSATMVHKDKAIKLGIRCAVSQTSSCDNLVLTVPSNPDKEMSDDNQIRVFIKRQQTVMTHVQSKKTFKKTAFNIMFPSQRFGFGSTRGAAIILEEAVIFPAIGKEQANLIGEDGARLFNEKEVKTILIFSYLPPVLSAPENEYSYSCGVNTLIADKKIEYKCVFYNVFSQSKETNAWHIEYL